MPVFLRLVKKSLTTAEKRQIIGKKKVIAKAIVANNPKVKTRMTFGVIVDIAMLKIIIKNKHHHKKIGTPTRARSIPKTLAIIITALEGLFETDIILFYYNIFIDVKYKIFCFLKNKKINFQRDDAKAFADGMQVLIDANTYRGKVDEDQLIKDIHFFTIDQHPNLIGLPAKLLHGFEQSNAAHNLMGGRRMGTVGWSKNNEIVNK
ncbi:MAG: hypothetical protein SFZ03_00125 [Candidatus Melainabacteria bacterium]|nr:hypothetical protein [Candidatus Melainabacteria bacterium]